MSPNKSNVDFSSVSKPYVKARPIIPSDIINFLKKTFQKMG